MTMEISPYHGLRLVLVSTGPALPLAVETLALHLVISPAEARLRLSEVPSVLAEGLDPERARKLADLLRSFGAQVRLDSKPAQALQCDLSIRLAVPLRQRRTIRLVAAETGLAPEFVADQLLGPAGLVLTGLTHDALTRLQSRLGRLNSLTLTKSDPASAVYDVFLPRTGCDAALTKRLQLMGAEPDALTGAIASGLDRALCRHLSAHFPDAGLLVLNRAFVRFDLHLVAVTGWVTQDLADFLIARTGLPRCRFETISDKQPLQIELGLTHAAARQFRADYNAIGLHTQIVLTGLAKDRNNTIV